MKAAIFHAPRHITMEEVDRPTVDAHGVLIRVHACGICGSDLHVYRMGLYADFATRASPQGRIPGHEYVGEIVEVGGQVTGLAVGDRVIAFSFGGMAEYVPVSPAYAGLNVVRIPDSIPDAVAATLEPLSNSVHAARKGQPDEGDSAVVFGAGIIGLGVLQCLGVLAPGLKQVIAVDVSDYRLEMARRMGADHTINVRNEALFARVMDLTGEAKNWMGVGTGVPAVDVAYDCVGLIAGRPEAPVLQQAMAIVRPQTGRIVEHGIFEAPATLELNPLVTRQISLLGSYGFMPEDTAKAVELVESGRVDRSALITGEFPLSEVAGAFEAQDTTDRNIKVILKP